MFHSKAEVEGLYQSLSKYAGVNGLIISKIEKKKPILQQQYEELIQMPEDKDWGWEF